MQRRRRSPTDTSIINSRRRSKTNTFYFVGNKRHEQTVLAVFETDIETAATYNVTGPLKYDLTLKIEGAGTRLLYLAKIQC